MVEGRRRIPHVPAGATLAAALLLAPVARAHNYTEFWSDYPVRDTCVTFVAALDTYFLIGTTGSPTWWSSNKGVQLWRSADMRSWSAIGTRTLPGEQFPFVWTFESDRTWQNLTSGTPALWAPELHYIDGTFFIPYCVSGSPTGTGLLRSTSGRPEGPYADVKPAAPLTTQIDASLFQDPASSTVFFLHQNGLISAMNADMTDLLPNNETLLVAADGQAAGFEGVFALPWQGAVFVEAARFEDLGAGQVYSCHVMRSLTGSIYGPFGPSYLLDPHCGHSVLFADREGQLWSTVFGNDATAPFHERPGAFRIEVNETGQLVPVAGSRVDFRFGPSPPPPSPTSSSADPPFCNVSRSGQTFLDIRTVPPDLVVPQMTRGAPAPGARVYATNPTWNTAVVPGSAAYFALYLPPEWAPAPAPPLPVIVELAGNGPYNDANDDLSTGRCENSSLGFGITAGLGAIWVSMPMLTRDGDFDGTQWWGCPAAPPGPSGDPPAVTSQCSVASTNASLAVAYIESTVLHIISEFNGDQARVVVAGFSRGAIGVNYLGLAADSIAALWRASIAYAHYDGQPEDVDWPYPDAGPPASYERLRRLGSRPQFVVSELDVATSMTEPYVRAAGFDVNATFMSTGFCNHNDKWVLRPSAARTALRKWWADAIAD